MAIYLRTRNDCELLINANCKNYGLAKNAFNKQHMN